MLVCETILINEIQILENQPYLCLSQSEKLLLSAYKKDLAILQHLDKLGVSVFGSESEFRANLESKDHMVLFTKEEYEAFANAGRILSMVREMYDLSKGQLPRFLSKTFNVGPVIQQEESATVNDSIAHAMSSQISFLNWLRALAVAHQGKDLYPYQEQLLDSIIKKIKETK